MKHYIKHLNYFIFAIFILLTSNVLAQYNIDYSDSDSSTYYFRQFTKNQDSLSKSWIGQKIKISNELVSVERTVKIPGELGLEFTPRAAEILSFYTSQSADFQKSVGLYNFYKIDFENALIENELPVSLSALTFALTAMNIQARSYTGGSGYWQMNYSVGKRHGLMIDSYVDERLDVRKSSEAAAENLKVLFSIYKDWKLVIAAYVCGPTSVNKAIRRNDNSIDYYKIQSSLPFFGRDAVDALAASLVLLEQSKSPIEINYQSNSDTVEVSKRTHFIQLQDILGLNIDELRFLNPIYKYDIVPAVNKVYLIHLPKGFLAKYNELEDSIHSYKDSSLFCLQRKVILPPPPSGRHWATPVKEETPPNSTLVYYTIKSGDNLGLIASWYDVKVSQLEDWNNIYDPRKIQIGKKLKIYVPEDKASHYRQIDKKSSSQKKNLNSSESSTSSSSSSTTSKPIDGEFFYHTVKSGESPYTIAAKYEGVSAEDILKWNNISDATKIQVGQKLKIKKNP